MLSAAEREEIIKTRQQEEPGAPAKLTFSDLSGSKNMWSVVLQYFCSNFTFFFALTWLFPYFKETYNLSAMDAGWYTSAPFIAGAVGNWVAGGMIDKIYRNGNMNLSRN